MPSPSCIIESVTPLNARRQRSDSLKLLEEAFGELGRIIPVLLLDEAQNYAMSALEELRMLLGRNLPEQPAFALILVGDPYAFHPAPALPSGTLFPDRRSCADPEFAPAQRV